MQMDKINIFILKSNININNKIHFMKVLNKLLLFTTLFSSYSGICFSQNNDFQIFAQLKTSQTPHSATQIDSIRKDIATRLNLNILSFENAIKIDEKVLNEMAENAIKNTGSDKYVRQLKNIYQIEINNQLNATTLIEMLSSTNIFEYVESINMFTPPPADIAPPTPNLRSEQIYLKANPGINVEYAWSKGIFGQGIKIIDVEYGHDTTHEKLEDQNQKIHDSTTISSAVNPSFLDHGTAVLGLVYGDKEAYGTIGTMHGMESAVMVSEYSQQKGYNRVYAVSKAIEIAQPGDIIMYEMQTGVDPDISDSYGPAEYNVTIWNMTKAAVDAGIVIVAAAGNGNIDLDNHPNLIGYRGRGDSGAIIVGAGTPNTNHDRLSFSSYGSRVNVQGWGRDVLTPGYGGYAQYGNDPRQSYNYFSGTSSATPIVSTAVVAIQCYYKSLTNRVLDCKKIRNILIETGITQGNNTISEPIGPLPNIETALKYVDSLVRAEGTAIREIAHKSFNIYPNPASTFIQLDIERPSNFKYLHVFDISGKLIHLSSEWNKQIDISSYNTGTYKIVILNKDGEVYTSTFVKN
jgi:hypothetical protein